MATRRLMRSGKGDRGGLVAAHPRVASPGAPDLGIMIEQSQPIGLECVSIMPWLPRIFPRGPAAGEVFDDGRACRFARAYCKQALSNEDAESRFHETRSDQSMANCQSTTGNYD